MYLLHIPQKTMIIMGTGMPSPEVLATDTDTRGGDDKKDLEDAAAAAEEEKEEVVEAADGNENLASDEDFKDAFAEEEAYASNTTQQKKWESDEGRVLSFWDVFMLQSTYSTAGMIVITPYIFGQWGYVLGPILYALWMLLVYGMACFVCNVMQQSQNEIKHMGDVGFELSGRWGRIIFNTVYMISMISFLPVALETIVISLQAIFGTSFITGKGCVGYWKLITAFALLIFLQNVKRWKGAAWISYVSVILLAIKSFVLIPWGLVAGQETYETSPFNLGPAKPLLSPEPTWTALLGGLYVYTSYATLILTETVPHTKNPKEYNRAMGYAHIFMFILYLVPGVCGALLWGWNVPFLLNTAFVDNPAVRTILNLIIVGEVSLDYIIASIIVNDAFRRVFISPDAMGPEWWQHLKATVPSLLFALVICVAVPNFETIVNLASAIGGTPILTFVISFAWLCGGRKFDSNIWMHAISIIWGVPTFIAQQVYAIYSIVITDYSLKDLFCLGE